MKIMDFKERVNQVIDEIRPALLSHGGGVELTDIIEEEKIVVISLVGACHGCPMSTQTFKHFVEKKLLEEIPEIKEVRLA
jgi:Fe-S cluster biogenesis protein NfuA